MSGSFKQISERLLTSSNYEQVDEVEWDIQKLVKIHYKTEKENQKLREQHERNCKAVASILNIIISEGLESKHKERLSRIFERQTGER